MPLRPGGDGNGFRIKGDEWSTRRGGHSGVARFPARGRGGPGASAIPEPPTPAGRGSTSARALRVGAARQTAIQATQQLNKVSFSLDVYQTAPGYQRGETKSQPVHCALPAPCPSTQAPLSSTASHSAVVFDGMPRGLTPEPWPGSRLRTQGPGCDGGQPLTGAAAPGSTQQPPVPPTSPGHHPVVPTSPQHHPAQQLSPAPGTTLGLQAVRVHLDYDSTKQSASLLTLCYTRNGEAMCAAVSLAGLPGVHIPACSVQCAVCSAPGSRCEACMQGEETELCCVKGGALRSHAVR
ncbi:unnamed protein product [Boreogadus saida]